MSDAAEAAVRALLEESGDPDDALRAVVAALVDPGGFAWAGIVFVEGDELVLGPQAGEARPGERVEVPVTYRGARVADLVADGAGDRALLERVAPLLAAHCLVGWDTGGVPWDPAA